jgi:hypothetical protein
MICPPGTIRRAYRPIESSSRKIAEHSCTIVYSCGRAIYSVGAMRCPARRIARSCRTIHKSQVRLLRSMRARRLTARSDSLIGGLVPMCRRPDHPIKRSLRPTSRRDRLSATVCRRDDVVQAPQQPARSSQHAVGPASQVSVAMSRRHSRASLSSTNFLLAVGPMKRRGDRSRCSGAATWASSSSV